MSHWKDMGLAALDTETTALDVKEARVIEVGIVCFEKGEVVEVFESLIDPTIPLPEEATKVTGITQEDLEGKPTFAEVIPDILRCLKDRIFVAYNASYDLGVLREEFKRAHKEFPELTVLDPLILARGVLQLKSFRLQSVAEKLGVTLTNAHRARYDAEAAGRVLLAMAPQLPADLKELLNLQSQWAGMQDAERKRWKGSRGGGIFGALAAAQEDQLSLGPAYVYSKDTDPDPLKAFIIDFASRHSGR